jgi:hypothetical protein
LLWVPIGYPDAFSAPLQKKKPALPRGKASSHIPAMIRIESPPARRMSTHVEPYTQIPYPRCLVVLRNPVPGYLVPAAPDFLEPSIPPTPQLGPHYRHGLCVLAHPGLAKLAPPIPRPKAQQSLLLEAALSMGCGENLRLAGASPVAIQRLRVLIREPVKTRYAWHDQIDGTSPRCLMTFMDTRSKLSTPLGPLLKGDGNGNASLVKRNFAGNFILIG